MNIVRHPAAHGAAGFLLMGGWAVFANRAYPMPAPLVAGVVQGCLTAGITLILKRVIEAVILRVAGPAGLVLAPLAAATVSVLCLTAVHAMAGTPALVATISVPVLVSTGYAILYAATLRSHG